MAMLPAKRQIVINAPVNDVFSYLTDFTLHGEWDGAPDLRVERTSGVEVDVGFICERRCVKEVPRTDFGGFFDWVVDKSLEKILTVTEFVPKIRLEFRVQETDHVAELVSFEVFEQIDGSTRVIKETRVLSWLHWSFRLLFWPIFLVFFPLYGWFSAVFRIGYDWQGLPCPLLNGWYQGRHLQRIKSQVENRYLHRYQ